MSETVAIPRRKLGKNGPEVSIIGIGGGHIGRQQVTPDMAETMIRRAFDAGITFFDNAWDYWDGESELRMGRGLQGIREDVVLMTKVCARDRETALQQLDDSLRRLQTDHVDVWQFHEINYDNDPDWLFQLEGAMEAVESAVRSGKVRLVGFTGHKSPHILKRMLEQDFPWDTCQMPISVLDSHFRSFQEEILPLLVERGIGVIGMKSLGGRGQLVAEAGFSKADCRRYALSQPISTLVVGVDSPDFLEEDIAIAQAYVPMTEDEAEAFRQQAEPHAGDGRYEWYKTTQFFDSAYHRNQHGFPPLES